MVRTEYLDCIFRPGYFQNLILDAVVHLRDVEFDTVAFTGVSGAALGFPLGAYLGCKLLCIRKPSASAHCRFRVEGDLSGERIVLVDDFVSSGDTIRFMLTHLKMQTTAKVVGLYTYRPRAASGQWMKEFPDLTPLHPESVKRAKGIQGGYDF